MSKKPFTQTAAMKQQLEADEEAIKFYKEPKHREQAKEIVSVYMKATKEADQEIISIDPDETEEIKIIDPDEKENSEA